MEDPSKLHILIIFFKGNQVKLSDVDKTGMVTVVSKNQGWITLTPRSMNRKKPLERGGNSNDNTKTSILTPSWMQIPVPQEAVPKSDPLEATTFGVLRKENKRTFLSERDQPKRSVFGAGAFRHNIPYKDTSAIDKLSLGHNRPYEWKEDTKHQSYDSQPVADKIGHQK
jgi:hypothetical protein